MTRCKTGWSRIALTDENGGEFVFSINIKLTSFPPANEVWGKAIFLHLHLCVILFTGGSASRGGLPPSGVG